MSKLTQQQLQRANVAHEKLQQARNALDAAMGELLALGIDFYKPHRTVSVMYDLTEDVMKDVRKRCE